jgi:hypothetical protein
MAANTQVCDLALFLDMNRLDCCHRFKKMDYIFRAQVTGLHATELLAEKFENSAHTVVLLNLIFYKYFHTANLFAYTDSL